MRRVLVMRMMQCMILTIFCWAGTGTPALSQDFTTGLVAHWPFEEASGNATDATGNGHTATAVNAPTRAAGKIGTAASLNGTSQYFSVADHANLNPTTLTVAAWINPTTWSSFRVVVSKQSSTTPWPTFDLRCQNGSTLIEAGLAVAGVNYLQAGSAISTGVWTHVAMTYDGEQILIYTNGTASSPNTTPSGNSGTTTAELRIGENPSFTGRWFAGLMDEVRLYNRALTQTDMTALVAFTGTMRRKMLWLGDLLLPGRLHGKGRG